MAYLPIAVVQEVAAVVEMLSRAAVDLVDRRPGFGTIAEK